jgi:hypothetical protein
VSVKEYWGFVVRLACCLCVGAYIASGIHGSLTFPPPNASSLGNSGAYLVWTDPDMGWLGLLGIILLVWLIGVVATTLYRRRLSSAP